MSLHIVFFLTYRFIIVSSLIIIVFTIIFSIRTIYDVGVSFHYFKALLISMPILYVVQSLNEERFLHLIRIFIFSNSLMLGLSLLIYFLSPYYAYGGRLLGNYANPNTSAAVYLIILNLLLFLEDTFLMTQKKLSSFFLFLIGLFSSVSKFYIIAFFLSFMVFAKVFILPIVLVLFVSFATLLVFNPIFVGFLEKCLWTNWQSHTSK